MATQFNKGDRVSYDGHLGTVLRMEGALPTHVPEAAVVLVEMDDPETLLNTRNPIRFHAGSLELVPTSGFAEIERLTREMMMANPPKQAPMNSIEGIAFEVPIPNKAKTKDDECIVTVVVNGRHFSVGDEVTALGFPGVVRGFYHDGVCWRAEVDMKDPEKVLGHPNPAHPAVANLRPNGPSVADVNEALDDEAGSVSLLAGPNPLGDADVSDMAKALGMAKAVVVDEAWLRRRANGLEKELEVTTAALHSTKDDLEQARQIIQWLLIASTCTDLPPSEAAAVRQAVMFLGGTSE